MRNNPDIARLLITLLLLTGAAAYFVWDWIEAVWQGLGERRRWIWGFGITLLFGTILAYILSPWVWGIFS